MSGNWPTSSREPATLTVTVPFAARLAVVIGALVGFRKARKLTDRAVWSAELAPKTSDDMFNGSLVVVRVAPRVAPLTTLNGPPPLCPVQTINSAPLLVTSVKPL